MLQIIECVLATFMFDELMKVGIGNLKFKGQLKRVIAASRLKRFTFILLIFLLYLNNV
jgi:hypothetical protein